MKTVLALVVFLVVLALLGLGFLWSGLYDVSADTEHTGLVHWILDTTLDRSVHRRAEQVRPPDWLANPSPQVVRHGLVFYEDLCATCHGAPGTAVSAIGQGLNPHPPELALEEEEEPGEVFWVVKHGIRMTGMPAFSGTLEDEEIWAIVAAVGRLRGMTREEYEKSLAGEPLAPSSPPAPL